MVFTVLLLTACSTMPKAPVAEKSGHRLQLIEEATCGGGQVFVSLIKDSETGKTYIVARKATIIEAD